MSSTKKIFHADVVGSMQRPPELIQARAEIRADALAPDSYRKIEDAAVDAALALQEEVGLEVVTDGEMRREFFFDLFIGGLSGLTMAPARSVAFHNDDSDEVEPFTLPVSVTDKVEARECPGLAEFRYAAQHTDKLVKVTLPSPMLALHFYGAPSRDAYPDPFQLASDTADAVEQWMRQLADAGCRYIQIDAPEMCVAYVSQQERDRYDSIGIPADGFLSVGTELLARLGRLDLPGVTKAMHVCKGNGTQSWLAEGGYDEFAQHVWKRVGGFDVFHMEYDDDRSGDFEPLRHLPDDKVAALGLVSTKWSKLEDPEALVARIDDAARFHPKEHLAIAPQCGFASGAETAEQRKVLPETQREKLRLVTSVAQRVWD